VVKSSKQNTVVTFSLFPQIEKHRNNNLRSCLIMKVSCRGLMRTPTQRFSPFQRQMVSNNLTNSTFALIS